MKCHYEVLELSREADDGEIKSAYRKLALKWHPDKNLDNSDFAKEQFQIIQQAYEVLSDKQERAWYDAHREQILRGASSEFQDKSLDVFQYFTTTCFKGYSDDDGGYYSIYRKVFDQLAKEDTEFMEEKEDFCEIPSFGKSDSTYEFVKAFYDYWLSYSTKKSYSWLDPYDVREGTGRGDRRVLKMIEKENKKVRIKARKERNEEVRNLVAFVRKRDRRMQAFKKEMEAKTLENRKKQEQISKQKRLERKQMHESEEQADWLKFDNVQSELEEIEKHLAQEFGEYLSHSEEDEEEVEAPTSFYCVACNKVFKNPKAFENHEISKKHRENIEKLRESMLEEDLKSNKTDDLEDCDDVNVDDISDIQEDTELKPLKKNKKRRKAVINDTSDPEDQDIAKASDNDQFDFGMSKSQKKKSKKGSVAKQTPNPVDNENQDEIEGTLENLEDEESQAPTKKQIRKEKRAKKEAKPIDSTEIDTSQCCVTCKNKFPSKNKLFDHLKRTGHGVYLSSKPKKK